MEGTAGGLEKLKELVVCFVECWEKEEREGSVRVYEWDYLNILS